MTLPLGSDVLVEHVARRPLAVADVGGTNTRLGLMIGGALAPDTIRSFRNDDFAGFDGALSQYLTDQRPGDLGGLTIAIAGPVTGDRARLTNRNWIFDAGGLAAQFGAPVSLLNDLNALGHSVPYLPATSLDAICGGQPRSGELGQALVVGVGTGFNVSPVMRRGGFVGCSNAEMGHVGLPLDLYRHLQATLPDHADDFPTVEHCFSGRGYALLHAAITGESDVPATQIGQRGSESDLKFLNFYAELLALMTRNLVVGYLPDQGVYFAGGVARNLLAGPARARFCEVMDRPYALSDKLSAPVFSILDDAAALKGCAHFASS